MEEQFDFLGTPIRVGERALRVHESSNMKSFKKVTIEKIDLTRKYGDCIGVITDGNKRIGWTYPMRLLVQDSIKIDLNKK